MFVKPKQTTPPTIVRDPRSLAILPPEGKRVSGSSYWVRRLQCGDVVETTELSISEGRSARLSESRAEVKREADAITAKSEAKPSRRSKRGGE